MEKALLKHYKTFFHLASSPPLFLCSAEHSHIQPPPKEIIFVHNFYHCSLTNGPGLIKCNMCAVQVYESVVELPF